MGKERLKDGKKQRMLEQLFWPIDCRKCLKKRSQSLL
jgi:hypothetical protein